MNRIMRLTQKTKITMGFISMTFLLICLVGLQFVQERFYASAITSYSIPSNWVSYTAPDNSFSLKIPPGWTASISGGVTAGSANSNNSLTMITYSIL